MATPVPLKFYKYQTNGKNYYQALPQGSVGSSHTEVKDLSEVQAHLSEWQNKKDDWSQNYASNLQSEINKVQSGQSPYVLNDKGILATQQEVASQQQEQADFASGKTINLGTAEAPRYVPKGTPTPEQSNAAFQAQQPKPQPQVAVNGQIQPQNTQSTQSASNPTTQPIQAQTHTVQPGDNLTKIAQKYGVPIGMISGYRSGNPNLIFPGEVLKIGGMIAPTSGTTSQEQIPATGADTASGSGLTATMPTTDPLSALGLSSAGTTSIDDVIKKVSQAFGIEGINKELQDLDDQYAQDVFDVNDNPWLSEAARSKKIGLLQDKYESKKNALIDRLKSKNEIIGKAIDLYQSERTLQQNLTLKAMDLKQKQVEENNRMYEADREFEEDVRQFGLDYALDKQRVAIDQQKANQPGGGSLPTSYEEWQLAGGIEGTGKTYAEWVGNQNIKPATVAQQTIATYAARIEQANPTLKNLEGYITGLNPASFELQSRVPSYLQSSQFQQYMQAARNFVNAVLRRESGAVISPSEFENAYNQYLPRPNDSAATLAQKRTSRDIVYESFKKGAGSAFQSVDELLGGNPSSGTTIMTGPDGKKWNVPTDKVNIFKQNGYK